MTTITIPGTRAAGETTSRESAARRCSMTWLAEFFANEEARTAEFEESGAVEVAKARRALLERLRRAELEHLSGSVSVEEAAEITGLHAESIRRLVRRGETGQPGRRRKQTIRIPRKDLPLLAARARGVAAERPATTPPSMSRSVENLVSRFQ